MFHQVSTPITAELSLSYLKSKELVMPLKARLADEYLNGDAIGRKIRHTTNAPRVCIGEEK